MKKDRLKEYIKEHREELDSEFPSEGIWDKIERRLDQDEKPKVFSIQRFIPYAVAAIILVGAIFLWPSNDPKIVIEDFTSDFSEVENYYLVQVNDKLNDLEKYEIDPDLMEEVSDLKKEFDELKLEMGVGADPGVVIEAMIENYRLRLELLEDLLSAMERPQRKNTKNEILN